jgi:hypothetical protein
MSEQALWQQVLQLQQEVRRLETIEMGSGIPSGAVAYFVGTVAPSGWTEYVTARGRMIVGLPSGGTSEGTVGTALTNLQDKTHTHAGPSHTHTGPSHTHTGPSHTHTGPSHTHTGPSHGHSLNQDGDNTHGIGVKIVTGSNGTDGTLYTSSGAGTSGGLVSTTTNAGTGNTGAEGTGNTGGAGTGNTGSGGTGASGAEGTGATGTSALSAGLSYIQLLTIHKT